MRETVAVEHLKLLYQAKIADQAFCWKDMKDAMKELSLTKQILNEQERRLLERALKQYITPWRETYKIAQDDSIHHADAAVRQHAEQYAAELKEEIVKFSIEVIHLIRILRKSITSDIPAKAFYYKVEADYHRYMSEVDEGNKKFAEKAYTQAFALIESLPKQHATRLGIALNYAIFLYTFTDYNSQALNILEQELPEQQPHISDQEAYQTYRLMKDSQKRWTHEQRRANQLVAAQP